MVRRLACGSSAARDGSRHHGAPEHLAQGCVHDFSLLCYAQAYARQFEFSQPLTQLAPALGRQYSRLHLVARACGASLSLWFDVSA